MPLKRNNYQFFFGNVHRSEHKRIFLKKMCVHLKGECRESFPECLNGLGCVHKLIKEHLLETLGWFK